MKLSDSKIKKIFLLKQLEKLTHIYNLNSIKICNLLIETFEALLPNFMLFQYSIFIKIMMKNILYLEIPYCIVKDYQTT